MWEGRQRSRVSWAAKKRHRGQRTERAGGREDVRDVKDEKDALCKECQP